MQNKKVIYFSEMVNKTYTRVNIGEGDAGPNITN